MATKERDRATSNYKLARTAVHDIYVGMMVTDDRSKVTLMQDPAVRPVRDFLLGRILNYQRGFIKKNPADMTVRLELAEFKGLSAGLPWRRGPSRWQRGTWNPAVTSSLPWFRLSRTNPVEPGEGACSTAAFPESPRPGEAGAATARESVEGLPAGGPLPSVS